jgi:hypothetical protein
LDLIEQCLKINNLPSREGTGRKKCRIKLNIVSTDYSKYHLVSNNFGIDFTELGSPHVNKPAQEGQDVEKQKDDKISGQSKEKAIIHDHVNRLYNQFVVDPNTKRTEENFGLSI